MRADLPHTPGYIHLNPTGAKLTRPAERWRWSSYRDYVGGPSVTDWVDTGPVLAAFGGSRARYRAYVEAGRGEAPVNPFERAVAGLVLGSEGFVARIRRLTARRSASPEQPALRALRDAARPAPGAIERAVAAAFADAGPALPAAPPRGAGTGGSAASRCMRYGSRIELE